MSRKRLYAITSAAAIVAAAIGTAPLLTGPASAAPKQAAAPPIVVSGNLSAPGGDSFAQCPAGTQLSGGGYESAPVKDGYGNPVDVLAENEPSRQPNTWVAHMMRGILIAYAVCTPSTSPPPLVVEGAPAPGGQWSVATCPAGTQLTGGGNWARTIATNGYGNPVDTETGNTPRDPNSWAARWMRGTVTARAMCTP